MNNTSYVSESSLSSSEIWKKGLRLLARRDYSVLELQKKLQERFSVEQELIEKVIQEFQEKGWVSDMRYAEVLVQEKALHVGWGPIKIQRRLTEKGIAKDVQREVLERIFPEHVQREVIQRLLEMKQKTMIKKTAPQRRAALQRFLLSRGFPFSLVLEVTESLR